MKINSKRQERNYIIIGLCIILVIMGVGYAAFSQLLTINGTANISNSWCVGFDNTKTNAYTPKAGITGATEPNDCIYASDGLTCITSDWFAEVYLLGHVEVSGNSRRCNISENGDAYCDWY